MPCVVRIVALSCPLIVAALCGTNRVSAAETVLKAGAAVVEITPTRLPVSMTGSFADRQATLVHDPLNARCLVLDDGTTRIALLTADCCLISRETFDEAKRRASAPSGIAVDHMLMSATHTHTAVTAMDLGSCAANPAYVEYLTARLAEAVVQAAQRLQPAKVGFGTALLPSEVHNRRWKMKPGTVPPTPHGATTDQVKTNPGSGNPGLIEPAGPTDPEVMVLAATTTDGKPLAVYAVYALHYVGGIPADSLSADYFGEFAKQLGERLEGAKDNPNFVGILANGTSGDINNINVRNPAPRQPPFEQIRIVAGRTAEAAVEAYRKMQFRSGVSLKSVETELTLGVRKPSTDDVAAARKTLETTDGKPANLVRDVYARDTLKMAAWPAEKSLKLQVLRIGELAIASIPCEPFVQIGLDIKAASKQKPTFVVGLANGYNGYLPTPEQHKLGGYETWRCGWSYLEPEASTKITAALVQLLNGASAK